MDNNNDDDRSSSGAEVESRKRKSADSISHDEDDDNDSSPSHNKRDRIEILDDDDEDEDDDDEYEEQQEKEGSKQEVSYTLKDGTLRSSDGKIQGATLHVQGKTSFTVESGEAILLLKLSETTDATPHPALVVGFYSRDEGKMFTIRVRWLITAAELAAVPTDFPWKGLDRAKVLEDMGDYDVVLSPQIDDLPVQSIVEKASVKLHWMYDDDDDNSLKHSKAMSADVPPGTFTCQYQLTLDSDHALHLDYLRLGTANDLEGTASQSHLNLSSSARGESHSSIESNSLHQGQAESSSSSSSSDDEGDGDEVTDEDEKRVVAEGEGSNLRTSIAVGPSFQAVVPPYQPNAYHSVTRRPAKPVWKPGVVSEETLASFLEKAAVILNSYLRKNLLTATEPYTPIPNEQAEQLMKEHPEEGLLTGSSLSTASVLSTARRNTLLKECDVDRLMERLFDCDGDVTMALTLVEEEPTRFICAWAQFEKDMFNDSFRTHHGAIRKIAKSVAPFKTVQEVIDYQYRFKIPDQFRLFQERKREIAARIVECIDQRRVVDPSSTETRRRPLGSSGQHHWSETNPSDLVTATEERRDKARQLMLDVHSTLGKTVTGQVANAVKELNRADTPAARAQLFTLLHGHTDLQRRFNEFLPKQVQRDQ